jgi:Ca2+-binding EF-hand superfamily protein
MIGGINSMNSYNSVSMMQMRQNLFTRMDTNSDGSVDKTEFAAMAPDNGTSFEEIFSKLDQDQDGVITQTEFETMMAASPPPPPPPPPVADTEEDIDSIFASLDTDGNGSIDKSELETALTSLTMDMWDTAADSTGTSPEVIFSTAEEESGEITGLSETESMLEELQAAMVEFLAEVGQNSSESTRNSTNSIYQMILKAYSGSYTNGTLNLNTASIQSISLLA